MNTRQVKEKSKLSVSLSHETEWGHLRQAHYANTFYLDLYIAILC